ncbi:MAG: sugar phosphate isomerase/epimerase [Chitinophagaceae bacterium]|nr:sugar phosphate isomerase/epimerase [Chitinophagaceae bacterium]
MLNNKNIAINTLAFNGYSWETALYATAGTGIGTIEPVYISKYDPALKESYFTQANAGNLLKQIKQAGLSVRSMASHMDMGLMDSVEVFQKRMEFAKTLGAEIILTNTSHIGNERQFFKNMKVLSDIGAELKLTIGLENPGDGQGYLMSNATDGVRILEILDSDRVRLNYDFSNIHTLSKGRITYDTGLGNALSHIGHLHLKNVRWQNDHWAVCGLGEGVIDYKEIFRAYPALLDVPMSIELPFRFAYDKDFNFVMQETEVPALEKISGLLNESILFLIN